MIFIPRFKSRKRLDTRGGMSAKVPAKISSAGAQQQVAATVLGTIANKIGPTLLKILKDERDEEQNTFVTNGQKELNNQFSGLSRQASAEQFDGSVGTAYRKLQESDVYKDNQKVKDAIDLKFAGMQQKFNANLTTRTYNKISTAKNKNLFEGIKLDLEEADINNVARINLLTEAAYEKQLENILWEETSKGETDEFGKPFNIDSSWKVEKLMARPDVKLRVQTLDNFIKSSIKNKAIKYLKNNDFSATDVSTLDKQIKEVDKWFDNDTKSSRSKEFQFLPLTEAYGIDKERFRMDAMEALRINSVAKRRFDNELEARIIHENQQEFLNTKAEMDLLVKGPSSEKNKKDYERLRTYLDNTFGKKSLPYDIANSNNLKRQKAQFSLDLMGKIFEKIENDGSHFAGDIKTKQKLLSEMGIPLEHFKEALSYVKIGERKETRKVVGHIKQSLNNYKSVVRKFKEARKNANSLNVPANLSKMMFLMDPAAAKLERELGSNIIQFENEMKNLIIEATTSNDPSLLDKNSENYVGNRARQNYVDYVFNPIKGYVINTIKKIFPAHTQYVPGSPIKKAINELHNAQFLGAPDRGMAPLDNTSAVKSLATAIKSLRQELKSTKQYTDDKDKEINAVLRALPLISDIPMDTENLLRMSQKAVRGSKNNTNVGVFEK